MTTLPTEPRYCDYYGDMSYSDFMRNWRNGTLDNYAITASDALLVQA